MPYFYISRFPRPAAHSPDSTGFWFSFLEKRTLPGNPGWGGGLAVFLNQPALQTTFLRARTRPGHLEGPCWERPGATTTPTAGAAPRPDPPPHTQRPSSRIRWVTGQDGRMEGASPRALSADFPGSGSHPRGHGLADARTHGKVEARWRVCREAPARPALAEK